MDKTSRRKNSCTATLPRHTCGDVVNAIITNYDRYDGLLLTSGRFVAAFARSFHVVTRQFSSAGSGSNWMLGGAPLRLQIAHASTRRLQRRRDRDSYSRRQQQQPGAVVFRDAPRSSLPCETTKNKITRCVVFTVSSVDSYGEKQMIRTESVTVSRESASSVYVVPRSPDRFV